MKVKEIFFILFLLHFSISSFGQKKKPTFDPKATFTPEQMQADFAFWRKCVTAAHPGVFWYMTEKEFDAKCDAFAQTLTEPMTERAFRNAFFYIAQEVKCGHSVVMNSKAREAFLEKTPVQYLPFECFSFKKQLFIRKSTDTTITTGEEILSIDGIAADRIIDSLANSFVSDGFNTNYKYHIEKSNFQLIYNRIFPQKDSFTFVLKDTFQQVRSVRLPCLKVNIFPLKEKENDPKQNIFTNKKVRAFRLDEKNPKIGILKIKSFEEKGFKKFYKKSFEYIEKNKIEHLVLDMRSNGGGNIFHPRHLLSYLIDTVETIDVYRKNQAISFKENLDKNSKSSLRFTERFFPLLPKKLGVQTSKNDSIINIRVTTKVRKKYHYNGKLYVLIDAGCFSATSMTAAFLKKNKRGIFIGDETGGGEKGSNALVTGDLTLPNTQIRYRFPFYRVSHNLTPQTFGRGIFPDIPIEYEIVKILTNQDLEMEMVRKIITK